MVNYMAAPGCKKVKTFQPEELRNDKIIFNAVCRAFGYTPDSVIINNHVQKREYVVVRQVTMTLLVLKLKFTLRKAGDFFGNKDHTTVLWAIKTVQNLLDTDRQFKEDVGFLFRDVVFPERRKYIRRTEQIVANYN